MFNRLKVKLRTWSYLNDIEISHKEVCNEVTAIFLCTLFLEDLLIMSTSELC